MNIIMTCCFGMSTSMLMESMRQYCIEEGKQDYHIWTVDQGALEMELKKKQVDVILLGPQVRHMQKRIRRLTGNQIPVAIIRGTDYGALNGANVVKYAEELIEEFQTSQHKE